MVDNRKLSIGSQGVFHGVIEFVYQLCIRRIGRRKKAARDTPKTKENNNE